MLRAANAGPGTVPTQPGLGSEFQGPMCVNACCAGSMPSSYGRGRDSIVTTYRSVIDCNDKLRSSHAIEVTQPQSVGQFVEAVHTQCGRGSSVVGGSVENVVIASISYIRIAA